MQGILDLIFSISLLFQWFIQGNERQRVYLATQLLSSSVSSLLHQCGLDSQAAIVKIFDDFFDVFNSKERDYAGSRS